MTRAPSAEVWLVTRCLLSMTLTASDTSSGLGGRGAVRDAEPNGGAVWAKGYVVPNCTPPLPFWEAGSPFSRK